MRLGVIALDLSIRVSINEVVHAHNFDLGGMTLARTSAILTDTAALKAPIVQFLLPLELLLKFRDLGLLRLE